MARNGIANAVSAETRQALIRAGLMDGPKAPTPPKPNLAKLLGGIVRRGGAASFSEELIEDERGDLAAGFHVEVSDMGGGTTGSAVSLDPAVALAEATALALG